MKKTLTRIMAVLLLLSMLFTTSCGIIPQGGDETDTGSQNVTQAPNGESGADDSTVNVEQLSEIKKGEIKDQNGNLLVPFDVAYPEVFASGDVEYAEDYMLVKMADSFDGVLSEGLQAIGVIGLEDFASVSGGTWYRAYIGENDDVRDVMDSVRAYDDVLMAEYDYIYRTEEIDEVTSDSTEVDGNDKDKDKNPNDGNNGSGNDDKDKKDPFDCIDDVKGNGYWNKQFHLGKHKVQDSWRFLKAHGISAGGSSSVIVAVIDTGVDYNHPDLKANMWVNTAEIPNNGKDDDGNGYIDDIHGCSTIGASSSHNGNPMDDHGHGTHIAGVIGASNNKEGIVGIAFNTKIMAIKAGQHSGVFNQSDIAEAILYAHDMGADVINMSFGGSACSTAVQDALMTAYTRCTLVASAGNDGSPNQMTDYFDGLPNYPAALSYVIGVMSVNQSGIESGFTNWDAYGYNTIEYEVYALGESIMSTLPGGKYGTLSGTSMAAPVVSATAALLRSYYSDRDMYPSKFIAAQICATSEENAICIDPELHTVNRGAHNLPMILDIYEAFTKVPKPEINLIDYRFLDETEVSDKNNGDGVVDAGETIDIATVVRNHWGMSKNTIVKIDSLSPVGIPNPYVEIITDSIDFKEVGTYSTESNYDYEKNIITGFDSPIRVRIKDDCPNDYRISLNVTITYGNALDKEDTSTYVSTGIIVIEVRSGEILPSQITEDMTLTKDNYYIIPNSTYIAPGVTVRVEPGTKIQFWSSDPNDPYADNYMAKLNVAGTFITEGTVDEPVELFPSDLMANYVVEINQVSDGNGTYGKVYLNYTTVVNPDIGITTADHCTFTQNYFGSLGTRYLNNGSVQSSSTSPYIGARLVSNSLFYKLSNNSYNFVDLLGSFDTCAFIDSSIDYNYAMNTNMFENCVFNSNYATSEGGLRYSSTYTPANAKFSIGTVARNHKTGTTYVRMEGTYSIMHFEKIRKFAKELGGDILCIETQEEYNYFSAMAYGGIGEKVMFVGLYPNSDTWVNGEPVGDFIKFGNESPSPKLPAKISTHNTTSYDKGKLYFDTDYAYYIIEIPGSIYCDSIQLNVSKLEIDIESKYQLSASVVPATFDQNQLVYVSEDEGIVTVSENGEISPVSVGKTRVFVYAPDYKVYDVVEVTVKEKIPVTAIEASSDSVTLQRWDGANIELNYTPSNTTEKLVTYQSSDESIVTVDSFGRVMAKGVGTAKIIVSGANGITEEITYTVISRVSSLTFKEKIYITYLGDDDQSWKPVLIPSNATDIAVSYLSSNPEIAYVDENGDLVRVGAGTTTIRAYVDGTDFFAETNISVNSEELLDQIDIVQMSYDTSLYVNAITDTNDLYIWGKDLRVPVKAMSNVKAAYSYNGNNYYYILDTSGAVKYYSFKVSGGKPILSYRSTIIADGVKALTGCSQISPVYYALKEDGSVWAWGCNHYGQLGNGTISSSSSSSVSSPIQMAISDVVDIKAAGCYGALMLCKNGDVYYSGGSSTKYSIPTKIDFGVTEIRGGHNNAIYEKADGNQYTIGSQGSKFQNTVDGAKFYNGYKQNSTAYDYLYIKDGIVYRNNVKVGNITNAVEVFPVYGVNLFYIKTSDGKLYGYGYNSHNQLADFTTTDRNTPTRIFFGLNLSENPLLLEDVNIEGSKLNDKSIEFDFNSALIISSSYASISLKNQDGNALAIKKENILDKLTITPYTPFENGKVYTLTIPSGAFINFVGLTNSYMSYTFTYENLTAIEFDSSNVNDGDVFDNQKIDFTINYTTAIKGEKFDEIAVTQNGEAVEGVDITLDGEALKISGTLDYGDYILTVPSGALADNIGGVNEEFVASFKVANVIKLVSSSVANGQTRVDENVDIVLTYLGALKGARFDEICLIDENGEAVQISVTLENNVLTISHETLSQGKPYTLSVPSGALCDEIGNENSEIAASFTTYSPVEIVYASPANTNKNVAREPHFTIIYNGSFELNEELISLASSSGEQTSIAVSQNGNTIIITAPDLKANETYKLILAEGALTDERGALSATVEYTLETVKETDNFYYTYDYVNDALTEWNKTHPNGTIYNSAILNNYNLDNVSLWLRMIAPSGTGKIGISGNFWGTTDEDFINKRVIVDFDKFNEYKDIVLGEILTTAPEEAYPFVVDAYVVDKNGERAETIGNETVTFVVEFNRDMDINMPLRVRFGSSLPYAEYEIKGEYVTARRWEGTYTLKTTIENGRQYINVENARADSDHYLILCEPDFPRFGFELDTTAAQAMIMQGEATEYGINLTWMQDDFPTLAGYNVYRSTKEDGNYIRLNDAFIPVGEEEFFDATVVPGVRYYYNFTVVKTDLSESTPSGKISIMSLDTMAPNVYHSPVRTAYTGSNLIITATVTDNLGIKSVKLYYRAIGDTEWKSTDMNASNKKYKGIIFSDNLTLDGIEYYIEAYDGISYTYNGTETAPHAVTVQLAVDANSLGDVDGDGIITNKDALMLLQAKNDLLNLTEEQFMRADIDGDGELSASEALTILKYVSGKITSIVG